MMESGTPPLASPMPKADDAKVSSHRPSPCNTSDVTFHICNSDSCHFRLCDMIFPPWLGFSTFLFLFMSCISYHVIMCISFAYVFISCIRPFSPLSVLQSDTPTSTDSPFCLFPCVGVKLSRNGPRFAKRPWFTTGRPPV